MTIYPDDSKDPETLMKNAETALHHAKNSGRNSYRFFSAEMLSRAMAGLTLNNALRETLPKSELQLYYQLSP